MIRMEGMEELVQQAVQAERERCLTAVEAEPDRTIGYPEAMWRELSFRSQKEHMEHIVWSVKANIAARIREGIA